VLEHAKNMQPLTLLLFPVSLSTREKDKRPCYKNFVAMCHRCYRTAI